jgi:DNA-binding response OmpR family regulator
MGAMHTTKGCILVADDDAAIREFLNLALTDEGYEVIGVTNGMEALDVVANRQPDLILLDMWMPLLDGRGFLHRYQQQPGPHAPVLLMSADDITIDKMLIGAAADFLTKPFDLDYLLGCIQQHIQVLQIAE